MNHFTKKNKPLEKLRGIYFQIGLIVAGGLTLVAFEWTTPRSIIIPCDFPYVEIDLIDELPPITYQEEPKKPELKMIEAPVFNPDMIEIIDDKVSEKKPINIEPTKLLEFNPDEYHVVEKQKEEKIHTIVGEMPGFVGGVKELFKYLRNNLKYPTREKEVGIQGTVHLKFVIGKKGEIKNIEVLRGVNDAIDNEAIRVLREMPNWKPGKQHGKTVNVKYMLPIKFKLK